MVDRLHTREICNDRATFQLLSRNLLTICYLSSLHRTHNKDGTKREGELGEGGGGVFYLLVFIIVAPSNCQVETETTTTTDIRRCNW